MTPRAWVNAPSSLSTTLGHPHGLGLLPLSGDVQLVNRDKPSIGKRGNAKGAGSKPRSARHQSAAAADLPKRWETILGAGGQTALTPFAIVAERLSCGKAINPVMRFCNYLPRRFAPA